MGPTHGSSRSSGKIKRTGDLFNNHEMEKSSQPLSKVYINFDSILHLLINIIRT